MKNIIIIVIALVIIGGGGYFVFQDFGSVGVSEQDKIENYETSWNTYSNDDFSIQYPADREWVYSDENFTTTGVSFGTLESARGGYIWSVGVVSKNVVDMETLIARMGEQFSDRKETRVEISLGGVQGLLVTVTTNKIENWIHKEIFIEGSIAGRDDKIYFISNGAIDDLEFERFYRSFKFEGEI